MTDYSKYSKTYTGIYRVTNTYLLYFVTSGENCREMMTVLFKCDALPHYV